MGVWIEKGLGEKRRRGQDPRLGWVWCYLVWIKGTGESVDSGAALMELEIVRKGEGAGEGRLEGWGLQPFRPPSFGVGESHTHSV